MLPASQDLRVDELIRTIAAGRVVWPGDCILVSGRVELLRWIIERVQRRLLCDLAHDHSIVTRAAMRRYARFTHTMCVLDPLGAGEMYRPHARRRPWTAIPPGTILLVRRHVDVDAPADSIRIADACTEDIIRRVGYPVRELVVYYLWSWGLQKLWLGRRFADVFRSRKSDVCSGRYVHWLHRAGYMENERPEAWYPARLAWDCTRFRTIACWRLVG